MSTIWMILKVVGAFFVDMCIWEVTLIAILALMEIKCEKTKSARVARTLDLTIHYCLVVGFPLMIIAMITLFVMGYPIPLARP